MAWYDNLITPFRVLINDIDPASYQYSDETLQKVLVTAATYVQREIKLSKTYSVSYSPMSINPDPSCDEIFSAFVVMKAACLKNQWDFNERAIKQAVTARCGPVSIEVNTANGQILLALINGGYCAAYEQMKKQHNFGQAAGIRSVLNMFSHSDYYVSNGARRTIS